MAVDSATTIATFDATKPAGADPRAELDDGVRHVKSVLKSNLPNINGTVSATDVELSYVSGVTSAIQTQLNAKANLASPALTGTPTAPTATAGTNTTQIATTAFMQAAIASVNATSGALTRSTNSASSFSVSAGQLVAGTNAGAISVTFPSSPTVGTVCGFHPQNNRTDNTIDLGSNSVMGPNGTNFSGVMTIDLPVPVVLAWYGDYWRGA